ncbi:MAG: hypothetical protein V4507_06880 [Verrucomicrobiota bacterium]
MRPYLILHSADGVFAIRKGPWKWIEGEPANPKRPQGRADEYHEQLYNLQDDPKETKDVLQEYPEVAQELKKILQNSGQKNHTRS